MENNLYIKSYAFAVKIVKTYQKLASSNKEYVLSNQLLKCGTSIGANVAESNGSISKADFSAKLTISYKECLETKFWLSILKDTGYLDNETYTALCSDADELAKILFTIIKKTRNRF